jgi:hypothetical protein
MTDKPKLQGLFEAALKDPSLPSGGIARRAFPVPVFDAMPVPRVEVSPLQAVHSMRSIPCVPVAALPAESPWQGSKPTMGRILDRAAFSELESLMQDQGRRRSRRPRLSLVSSATVLATLAAIGGVWWLQTRYQVPTTAEVTGEVRPAAESQLFAGENAETKPQVPDEATKLETGLSATSSPRGD